MIGKSEDLPAYFLSSLPWQFLLVNKDSHEFDDGDGRMGIVMLNGYFLRHLLPVRIVLAVSSQDIGRERVTKKYC